MIKGAALARVLCKKKPNENLMMIAGACVRFENCLPASW
jgi:hypothetical protein